MLSDKTEFFNRLEIDSNISVKSNAFGQPIKNPYLVQYKIFQERLKNPKTKAMSAIIRKRRNQQKIGKENLENEIRQFEQEQCIKQVKKVMMNEGSKFSVFSNSTIDYDPSENSKQSQILMKFKEKLHDLKCIKNLQNSSQRSRLVSVNLSNFTKNTRTQITSQIRSGRGNLSDMRARTEQMFKQKRDRLRFRSNNLSGNNLAENKLKLPITFVAYKRNKSFAEKFTKDKK